MPVDVSLIDKLFQWVQHPFALTAGLVIIVVVLARMLYLSQAAKSSEAEYCWEINAQLQKEILELTEFVIEGIALARARRTQAQQVQLAALETKVQNFKQQKELAYQRDQEARRARQ